MKYIRRDHRNLFYQKLFWPDPTPPCHIFVILQRILINASEKIESYPTGWQLMIHNFDPLVKCKVIITEKLKYFQHSNLSTNHSGKKNLIPQHHSCIRFQSVEWFRTFSHVSRILNFPPCNSSSIPPWNGKHSNSNSEKQFHQTLTTFAIL